MNWQERAENAEESLRSLASYVGAGGYNADTVDAEVFEQKIRWGIRQFMDRLEKAEAELARLAKQEPVAFWWTGLDGEPYGGPYRGTPSDAAIDNARRAGCGPQLLFAVPSPVPAVAAPSVPEEWREVMTELADDLAIEIDQSYPPERRAYPSEQRRYEGEMAIVNRARALLQSEVRHD